MADYTEVPDVTTGDSWTADNHDTYIRNNFKAVFDSLVAGRPVRLDATGKYLEVLPVTYAKYALSTNITLVKGNYTTINQWTAIYDANSWLSSSTNITPGAGVYRVSGQYFFSSIEASKTYWASLVHHSGSTDTIISYFIHRNSTASNIDGWGVINPTIIELAAGDYLWLKIFLDNSSNNATLYAYSERNYLNIEKLY